MKIFKLDIFRHLLYVMFFVFSLSLSSDSLGISGFFNTVKWPFLIIVFMLISLLFSFSSTLKIDNVSVCIFIFLIFQAISALIYNVDPLGTFGKIALIIFCLFFGRMIGLILSKYGSGINIVDIFVSSIFIMILISVLTSSVGITPIGHRYSGFFNNPNLMSGISAIALVYYACLAQEQKKIKYVSFCVLFFFCVIFTQSRGGLVTLVLSSFLFLYYYGYFISIKKIAFLVTFLCLCFSLIVFLDTGFSYRELTLDNRIESFLSQLSAFFYSPFFGLGFGDGDHSKFIVLSESTYVSLLSSSGILGTLVFILLLIFLYLKQIRIKDKLVLSSIFFLSISEAYLLGVGNPISLFFYLFIGSSITGNNKIFER